MSDHKKRNGERFPGPQLRNQSFYLLNAHVNLKTWENDIVIGKIGGLPRYLSLYDLKATEVVLSLMQEDKN